MRVLVVDDSKISRSAIRIALEKADYEVREAATGEDALRQADAECPDLMILDVGLPDVDGFEVCRRLRASNSESLRTLPVVFATANDTLTGRVRGFEVGGADFVSKTDGAQAILTAANQLLRPERMMEGALVVVVDDSIIARTVLSNHLREQGVEVIECPDGKVALEMLRQKGDSVDMVVTDLVMPGIDGAKLCSLIRRDLEMADIPVIIVTVVDRSESALALFKAGATDYMYKPYVKEELIARLNSHLSVRLLNKRLRLHIEHLKELDRIRDRFLDVYSETLHPPLKAALDALDAVLDRGQLTEEDRNDLVDLRVASEQTLQLVGNLADELHSWANRIRDFV